jgi:N-acetylglucosaminyldiphosphoundecaprenol N-acetyl-beta-D-mannosaminyltransferase
MIKTIDVAGIQLDNYTVREAIMNVERDWAEHGFRTIEEVNMDMLMMADSDEVIRKVLDSVDYTVIAEAGILDVVGAGSYQRKREIEHRDFFYELMKRIERNHKTVFVIGETSAQTQQLHDKIMELYPRCEIVGMEALEECMGATDAVVNEMNSLSPDVIVSILPSPAQEQFLVDNRDKLSAGLWYGIGMMPMREVKGGIRNAIRNLIRIRKLEKQLNHYNGKQENV